MTIGERIEYRMKYLGIKGVDITKAIGASSGTISQWLSGVNTPSNKYLIPLCELLQCDPDWLLYGKGEQPETTVREKEKKSEFSPKGRFAFYDAREDLQELEDKLVFVRMRPKLGMASGNGILNSDEAGHEEIPFPFYLHSLKKAGVKDPDKAIVGFSTGESNAPTIPHGAAVGIDTGCTRIIHKEIYLITVEGEERLKQILNLGEGRYMIRSLNPDKELYPDEIFDAQRLMETQFIVQGRMFWCSWIQKVRD